MIFFFQISKNVQVRLMSFCYRNVGTNIKKWFFFSNLKKFTSPSNEFPLHRIEWKNAQVLLMSFTYKGIAKKCTSPSNEFRRTYLKYVGLINIAGWYLGWIVSLPMCADHQWLRRSARTTHAHIWVWGNRHQSCPPCRCRSPSPGAPGAPVAPCWPPLVVVSPPATPPTPGDCIRGHSPACLNERNHL